MLLALVSPVLAGLLINEVVYDPSGADDGAEWVELCNNGADTLDLTGYQLENAGSSYSEVYTFASGSLAPGEHLLVGGGSSTHAGSFDPNLQNGGSDTDGLRIKDNTGVVIDTVLYDENNSNSLAEDDGTVPTGGAPAATNGKSIGRFPDCVDSDVSGADFILYSTAEISPGAENADPDAGGGDTGDTGTTSTDADCTGSDGIVINELRYATGEEYVELYNAGADSVALDAWQLAFGTRPTSLTEVSIDAGTTLAPGGFFVLGSSGSLYQDQVADLEDMGNASNTDGVLLTCNGAPIDTALYATENTDGWTDDSGAVATSLADKPGSSESVARVEDGVDTDQCGVDFAPDIPSPGYSNTAVPVGDADCTNSDGLKVNELDYATDAEWIELYNAGAATITLDAWVIEFGTSSYNKSVELPDGTSLAPGAWLVIGSAGAAVKDIELDMDMGNASDTDALRVTCNGSPIDTVLYGSPNDNGWVDDSGEVATSLAPKLSSGTSLARVQDGYDTDACGSDFAVSELPTPGSANPVIEPPVCDITGATGLKLNEVLYNPLSSDTGMEWVELYNAGSTAIHLDDYVLETATSSWGEDYRFPGGMSLAPGDYLVIGGEFVDEADVVAGDLSLGNGTRADGVRLVDCEGNVLDSVLYGDDLDDPITGDGGSTEVVPKVSDGVSIGRYDNGADTDAAADWHPYATPTPGEANPDPGAIDGTGNPKKGCGGQNSAPPGPGGGCTTVLPFGGMEVALAALALIRRRRS